jgi:hypothetical protein
MPAFLLKPLQILLGWLLSFLGEKIAAQIRDHIDRKRREAEIKLALKQYRKAQTKEEQERAFEDLVRTLNK